jgi:hypothetical protein
MQFIHGMCTFNGSDVKYQMRIEKFFAIVESSKFKDYGLDKAFRNCQSIL